MNQKVAPTKSVVTALPTPEMMKVFASFYNKAQWAKLCQNQKFLDVFAFDLSQAKKIADSILGA